MRRLIFILSFIMAASILTAFDFPAPDGKVTASFGSAVKGEFNTGIDIRTDDVFASEAGEVLYYGSDFIALAHDDSILTLYSSVTVSETLTKDVHVKRGQILGKTKDGILHFEVYDLEMEQYINPLLMTEKIKKTELPKVKDLSYDSKDGMLSVYMSDKGSMGLYRVQISVEGQVVSTLGFRAIHHHGETLELDREGFKYRVLYGLQGAFTFPDIQLKPGENNVDVIVTDFYGKKVVFHGRITV